MANLGGVGGENELHALADEGLPDFVARDAALGQALYGAVGGPRGLLNLHAANN